MVLSDSLLYMISAYYLIAMYISALYFGMYASLEYIQAVHYYSDYQLGSIGLLPWAIIQSMCVIFSDFDYD